MPSVLQEWVTELTCMQQSVLLTAIRGPDGVTKEHPAKEVLRWLRRCVLLSAFDRRVLSDPYEAGGGSFTGPQWRDLEEVGTAYFKAVDELPHHFQMHLMHAAEIIGYKHPSSGIGIWWLRFYEFYANALHLTAETEAQMDRRLGDCEADWRESEKQEPLTT